MKHRAASLRQQGYLLVKQWYKIALIYKYIRNEQTDNWDCDGYETLPTRRAKPARITGTNGGRR